MPHVIVEYSSNLSESCDPKPMLASLQQVMRDSGLFNAHDIKLRAYAVEDFLVGTRDDQASFAHVLIYLLEGRPLEKKQALTDAICNALVAAWPQVDQYSVDIRDLAKDTYRKHSKP